MYGNTFGGTGVEHRVWVCHLAALVVAPTGPQVGPPTNNNLDYSITSWYVHS